MANILVTGAAGLIGSNLCQKLLKSGHLLVACDNFITGRKQNIRQLATYPKFTFIKYDIVKPFTINPLRPRSEAGHLPLTINQIYHLACPTGVDNLVPLAQEMLLTCSLGTRNILEVARINKAKLLFTSSSEVYGDPQISPQSEDYTGNVNPVGPRSPYEEGKRFAESLITMYARKYKIDAKIVRVFNTYGPGMAPNDSRVIPTFLRQADKGLPLTIKGKGIQRRTFCYVDDLVDGLILIMKKGKKGEVYNLGSDSEIAIIELAQTILNVTKTKSSFKFVKRESHDHQMRLPDIGKVQRLGWRPKISLASGLKKTVQ